MSPGRRALAGTPETVREVGAWLKHRAVGGDVSRSLTSATQALGGQADSPVSVGRLRALLQTTAGQTRLVQTADQGWGNAIAQYGAQLAELRARAEQAHAALAAHSAALNEAQRSVQLAESSLARTMESGQGLAHGPRRAQAQESVRVGALVARQAADIAQERIRDSEHALRALDEERAGLDAAVSARIAECSDGHVAVRAGLPPHPRLSSEVRVTATFEGGWAASYSAFELARLGDPDAIRAVWNKLTQAARQHLLADAPELLGNLDGIPLRDRDQANRITAGVYRSEAEAQLSVLVGLARTPEFAGGFGVDIERLRGEILSIDAILGDRIGHNSGARSAGGQAFGEYLVYDERGKPTVRPGTTLVGFSPLRDSIVTYQGPLDPLLVTFQAV